MNYLFTYGPVPITEREKVQLKKTEIGEIPEEWEICSMKSISEKIVDCLHAKKPEREIEGKLLLNTFNIYPHFYIN